MTEPMMDYDKLIQMVAAGRDRQNAGDTLRETRDSRLE